MSGVSTNADYGANPTPNVECLWAALFVLAMLAFTVLFAFGAWGMCIVTASSAILGTSLFVTRWKDGHPSPNDGSEAS